MFITEKQVKSSIYPELVITLKRIALSQRLEFLARHAKELGEIKFLSASPKPDSFENRAKLEMNVCRELLKLCILQISGNPEGAKSLQDWLLDSAPQDLCVELISLALEEFQLSSAQAKN